MSAVGERLLGDAEAMLRREADRLRESSLLDQLIAAWILPGIYGADTSAVALSVIKQWRETKKDGAPRSYQSVGALALATILNVEDAERVKAFSEGLDWALGTSVEVDGAPVGLAADPATVLAVVTALLRTGDRPRQAAVRSWLVSIIDRFSARLGLWDRAQLHVASQLLGEQRHPPRELDDACCVTRTAVLDNQWTGHVQHFEHAGQQAALSLQRKGEAQLDGTEACEGSALAFFENTYRWYVVDRA